MQASPYARAVPAILAEMENRREANGNDPPPNPEEEAEKVVYVYPLEGGGVVFTDTPIEEDDQQPQALVVDAQETKTDTRLAPRREPAYFLHFLLILFVFVGLYSLTALLAPTVPITITPVVKTLSTSATVSIGARADIEWRIFPPLTLSQEQTVPATGKGHQDARDRTGTLIYFNGLFAPHTADMGTIFTRAGRTQVAT